MDSFDDDFTGTPARAVSSVIGAIAVACAVLVVFMRNPSLRALPAADVPLLSRCSS